MISLIKKLCPGTFKFLSDFFKAMSTENGGHSLRKWLAVGFFWLVSVCVFRYTNTDNVVLVLAALTAMITALVITYSVSNHQANKLEANKPPVTKDPVPDEPQQ